MTQRISSSMAYEKNPIYRLGQRVIGEELTLSEAMEQVVAEDVLAQVNDTTICQLNDLIRRSAEQDPARATVLAVLNCQAARHRGSDLVWGHCNLTLGWLYLQQYDLEPALRCYQEALEVFEAMPGAEDVVVRIRHDIGQVWERQSKFEAAIDEYQEALALAQRMELPELESDVRNSLGRVYLAQECVDDAMAAFQCALEVSHQCHDERGKETALGNLGQANHFLGRLREAAAYYEQALTISRGIDHQAGTGRLLGSLGNVLIELGELSRAEGHFLEALDIARQYHDRRGEQQRLGNLGNLNQAKAKREADSQLRKAWLIQADQRHREAATIARERNDRRGLAIHLLNQGNIYASLECFEAAELCYAEASRLAEEPGQGIVDTRWRIHYAWGNLCAVQRQDRSAFDHYTVGIEIVEDQRRELKPESRLKFWQERATLYKRMVLCCMRLGELWSALAYTERAKARYLADLLAERSSKGDRAPESSQIAVEPIDDTLSGIETVIKDLSASTAVVVFNVTEIGTVVLIVTDQSKGRVLPSDDGWRRSPDGRVRARLIEDFNRDDLQNLLIKVDDSGQAVGGYLVDYYADRAKWGESTLESVSADIYQSLLTPVHRELTRLSVERVAFMPNLGLSLLPLHACYGSNGSKGTERDYLLDHYQIAYAPSFDVLHHCQSQARSKVSDDARLLAIANPTGDLDWAKVEVECIRRLFPETRVLDGDHKDRATDNTVIAEASDYAFVHFACHGKFDLREPLQSALYLAPPALLTLDTALKSLKLRDTRLVVMSACETGLVDPGDLADEYVGLPAGFVKAGAPTVVASLWAVSDFSTALLMERFYANYLYGDPDEDSKIRRPLPPAEALRRAQIWLRDKVTAQEAAERCDAQIQAFENNGQEPPERLSRTWRKYTGIARKTPNSHPFAHPYHWAAFALYGATQESSEATGGDSHG